MNTATLKRALEIHGHRRLCGHEAGHCAAALTLGLQVASAAAPFHTLEDLEDGDPESPAGRVLILAPAGEREMALVTLMGRLEENKPDWPPTWPLTLAPEPGDEADLIEHVKALGLDEPGYNELVAEAHDLWRSPEYGRLHTAVAYALEKHGQLDARGLTLVKAVTEEDRMEHLTFKAATIAADLGEFEAIISTASVDRDGDVVDPAAMVRALHVWTETGKVIPLHWNHKSEPEDIVGYVNPDSAMQTGGEVSVTGRVDLDSPRGPEVWRLIKSGSIGFSYGYLVSEAEPRQGRGRNITAMDIFEVSVTPAPANADTRVLSWKSLGADPDLAAFKREFAESVRVHMNGDPGESLRDKAVRYEREHAPIQVAEFPC